MKITRKITTEEEIEVKFPIAFKSYAWNYYYFKTETNGINIQFGEHVQTQIQCTSNLGGTFIEGSEIIEKSEVEAAFNAATKQAKDFWAEPKSAEL